MKVLSVEERAYRAERENEALKAENETLKADLAYVAMMADVDFPEDEPAEAQEV